MKFDFDEWAQLAKKDNTAFEKKREMILKQLIDSRSSNEQDLRRLNGLQFKINMIRRQHQSPMGACIAISAMMMDKLYELVTLDMAELTQGREQKLDNNAVVGNIIAFDTKKKHNRVGLNKHSWHK